MKNYNFIKKYFLINPFSTSALNLEKKFFNFSLNNYIKFLNINNTHTINTIAEKRAISIFKLAAKYVPAYKNFLKKEKINASKIKNINDFQQIPLINKKNYLDKYSINELSWNNKASDINMYSASSGTSGKPYYWPRSSFLEYETAITHEIFSNIFFNINRKKTLIIDAYAMGMYVAGTFTLNSFRKIAKKKYNIITIAPGIEMEEVIRILLDFYKKFEQIIIAGYPPFIKDIIDKGTTLGIQWSKINIKFIFGAENFSEDWRSHLLKLVGKKTNHDMCYSSMNTYGSADCAILGHETPLSIKFRRFIHYNDICEKIFSKPFLPTLVQYNPIIRYFELINNELVFTAMSGIPLIRYNIKDSGGIITFQNLLKKINNNLINTCSNNKEKFLSKLPFLYLFGRSNNTICLYGVNIYPENIKNALEDDKIINLVSGKFKLKIKNDSLFNQYFEIEIELNNTTKIAHKQKIMIATKIINSLRKNNFEYAKLISKINKRAYPIIKFVARNTFIQIKSKHKWIQT